MKKMFPIAVALSLSSIFLGQALAQAENTGGFMGRTMFWGGGVMMFLFWGVIIFVLFVLARSVNAMHVASHPPPRTAIEILKERFARGEIDREEFEEKRKVLLH